MKKYLPLVVTLLFVLVTAAFGQEAKPSPEPSPKPKPAMSKAQIQKNLVATEKKRLDAGIGNQSRQRLGLPGSGLDQLRHHAAGPHVERELAREPGRRVPHV